MRARIAPKSCCWKACALISTTFFYHHYTDCLYFYACAKFIKKVQVAAGQPTHQLTLWVLLIIFIHCFNNWWIKQAIIFIIYYIIVEPKRLIHHYIFIIQQRSYLQRFITFFFVVFKSYTHKNTYIYTTLAHAVRQYLPDYYWSTCTRAYTQHTVWSTRSVQRRIGAYEVFGGVLCARFIRHRPVHRIRLNSKDYKLTWKKCKNYPF